LVAPGFVALDVRAPYASFVTEREPPADEPEVAKSEFHGFEDAIDRLFNTKPDVDAATEEMRQRNRLADAQSRKRRRPQALGLSPDD
jgi:hypothetical protein